MTIKRISEGTAIKEQDVIDALEDVKMLKIYKNKIYLCTDMEILDKIYNGLGRPAIDIKMEKLHWQPNIEKFEYFKN